MNKFKYLAKNKTSRLPKTSGVYVFLACRSLGEGRKKGQNFLYIGKAVNIRERVKNHFQRPTSTWEQFTLLRQGFGGRVGFIKTNSEIEALILEANLIKKCQPKYNIVWRDDKNYFYAGITKEDFPRIFITHQIQGYEKCSRIIGPFVDGKALKQTLKILRKVFPYRTCKTLPRHSCLWHQIYRCPAPCLIKNQNNGYPISIILKKKMKRECQRNADNLIKILQGKKKQVLKNLKKVMRNASSRQNFENAAKVRDQIKALERILASSKVFEAQPEELPKWRKTEKELKKLLKTKKKILRIEAYDVSNIQGKEASGGMITFVKGNPDKNFYRRFKIHPVKSSRSEVFAESEQFNGVKISGKPNDTAMIKEIISRRLQHPEWGWPDLILIDGGIGQLNAAINLKSQILPPTKNLGGGKNLKSIKLMALAKKNNELFIEDEKEPILLKNLPREVFNLILQLRDEAHRFALGYHKKLRKRALLD